MKQLLHKPFISWASLIVIFVGAIGFNLTDGAGCTFIVASFCLVGVVASRMASVDYEMDHDVEMMEKGAKQFSNNIIKILDGFEGKSNKK